MEQLQGMWAIRSRLRVKTAVRQPIRAAANAASDPACPAPTTITSKSRFIPDYYTQERHDFVPTVTVVQDYFILGN
jgi:hypothetical protein